MYIQRLLKLGRWRIKRSLLPGNVRSENGGPSCVQYTAPECTVISGRILVDKNFYLLFI